MGEDILSRVSFLALPSRCCFKRVGTAFEGACEVEDVGRIRLVLDVGEYAAAVVERLLRRIVPTNQRPFFLVLILLQGGVLQQQSGSIGSIAKAKCRFQTGELLESQYSFLTQQNGRFKIFPEQTLQQQSVAFRLPSPLVPPRKIPRTAISITRRRSTSPTSHLLEEVPR